MDERRPLGALKHRSMVRSSAWLWRAIFRVVYPGVFIGLTHSTTRSTSQRGGEGKKKRDHRAAALVLKRLPSCSFLLLLSPLSVIVDLAKAIGPTMAHRRISSCTLPLCLAVAAALLRIADAQLPDTDLGTCQVSTSLVRRVIFVMC